MIITAIWKEFKMGENSMKITKCTVSFQELLAKWPLTVADRATAHVDTCAHCVYLPGLFVDYAKLKRIPRKSQNALCLSKNIFRFEYYILNSL